jgi:nucleoside-diphosphate-sugar epimerase
MLEALRQQIRQDCRRSLEAAGCLPARFAGQRLAVVGGTGFSGTWLAECTAVLNDEFDAGFRLDLLGRTTDAWALRHPHLVRDDIALHTVDARSAFELPRDTTLIIYAAGIADPRVAASEPHRVFQTHLYGLDNTLLASRRIENIERIVNMGSGLVAGAVASAGALAESDLGLLEFTRLHNLYAESRRAAESLAGGFASQYRIPISTVRAFTFLGPYQHNDTPWAANSFIRDALEGHEIRIHGDGATRRSYLYGSDVAAWLLKASIAGTDGAVYNLGGDTPVSHAELAAIVSEQTTPRATVVVKQHSTTAAARHHDFCPDISHTAKALGVATTVGLAEAVARTMSWQAAMQGLQRRLAPK